MRRADRLFQIVQHLRGRRLTTAAQLASWLEVSHRTIYRDIRDLSLSGIPIEGEAGVGYRLSKGFDLPPIMFTFDEIEALAAGARIVESWGGPALASASRTALLKIQQALPAERRAELERTRLFAPGFHIDAKTGERLEAIRAAISALRKVELDYRDSTGSTSHRVIHPLGLFFWGAAWTVAAWCESRHAFRSFRLDRIRGLRTLPEPFEPQPDRTLEAYVHAARSESQPS